MGKLALIVEGDGDKAALPIVVRQHLLEREEFGMEVGRTINAKGRGNLLRRGQLERWLQLAALDDDVGGILVVCDAEDDAACKLGPTVAARCVEALPHVPVRFSLAVSQFENWIVASAETILGESLDEVASYESLKAQAIIREWRRPRSYVKPLHQPSLAAQLDHSLVSERCPSFGRLLRCIDELLSAVQ